MIDLSPGKLLVIALVALFLVGPEKLPQYATQLAKWVRIARSMVNQAKGRMKDELGPEFDDVDWATLDPRRYHPKRLLADAWNATDDAPRPQRPVSLYADVESGELDLLELAEARARAAEPQRTGGRYDLGS